MLIKCPECNHEFDSNEVLQSEAVQEAIKVSQEELESYKEKLVKEQKAKKVLEKQLTEATEKGKELSKEEAEKEAAVKYQKALETSKIEKEKSNKEIAELQAKVFEAESAKDEFEKEKQKAVLEERAKHRKEKTELEKQIRKEIQEQGDKTKDDEIEKWKFLYEQEKNKIKNIKERTELTSQEQGAKLEIRAESKLNEACTEASILDKIKRTKNAGDVVQTVIDDRNKECGIILWEIKDAARWSKKWIETLKADMIEREAAVGVIVIQDTLEGYDCQWHENNRIFVTKLNMVKSLAKTLRIGIIESNRLKNTQQFANKKLEVAYDFIFNGPFGEHLQQIIGSYKRDQDLLNNEIETMTKLWGERQTRIDMGKKAALTLLGGINEIKAIGDMGGIKLLSDGEVIA